MCAIIGSDGEAADDFAGSQYAGGEEAATTSTTLRSRIALLIRAEATRTMLMTLATATSLSTMQEEMVTE